MSRDAHLEASASQGPAIALLQGMGQAHFPSSDCEKQSGGRYHVLPKDVLRWIGLTRDGGGDRKRA